MSRLVACLAALCLATSLLAADGRAPSRDIPFVGSEPAIDGSLDEWQETAWFEIASKNAKTLHPEDLSARVWVAWDRTHLYLAALVRDEKHVNANPAAAIAKADCLVWYIGAQPEKQGDSRQAHDFRMILSPTSESGEPAAIWQSTKETLDLTGEHGTGIQWRVTPANRSYRVEVAIPVADLGLDGLAAGAEISSVVAVFDRDATDRDEWKDWHTRVESSSQKHPPKRWPLFLLKESVPLPAESKKAETQGKAKAKAIPVGKLETRLVRHKPANVFETGGPVTLELAVSGAPGEGQAALRLTDYDGKTVQERTVPITMDGKSARVALELGELPTGYYELQVETLLTAADGKQARGEASASLGVSPLTMRSAAVAREQGSRIGLKMWYLGDAWWRGNAQWDEREVTDATAKLGLQWTRALMQQTAHLSTVDLANDFPMNVILKVERFPKELYDADRYGPLDEWIQKNGKAYTLKTLPRKEPYQDWLRQQLAKLPLEQNVFEVWNEAWDKMSAEDLATVSNWIVEVILEERPDAVIGANLLGTTSKYGYDQAFIDAGGMTGMTMVALHPYGKGENRAWLRGYKQWLQEQTGRPIDIYVTEYGSHSTPTGPAKRSEAEQAQRVVRQTLALYAEDIKAMTPHWMGQREENPTYHEHWFGFYRLNHEPKPVLMALATCARMIDSSTYLGDLWYGPGVGAMLFEKDGTRTLALWTRDEPIEITVQPDAQALTRVNMVGTETPVTVPADGQLTLTVGRDVIYLSGVGPALTQQATTALREDRWPVDDEQKRIRRVAKRFDTMPTLDGQFSEWQETCQLAMVNPKVNGSDASGIAYLAWNEQYLFVALDMRDDQIMNRMVRGKLYREDSMEIFLSTEPRDENAGHGPRDYQFFVSPESKEGGPIVGRVLDSSAGVVDDVPGAKYHIAPSRTGWTVELALPWAALGDFTPQPGALAALELRVNDADTSHERWKIDPEDSGVVHYGDPTTWSLLEMVK